jgi:glycosyltransferase involved in cell wall biosynthesis
VHNALPHEPRRFDVALARFALSPVGAFVAHNASEAQRLQQDLHLRAPIAVCPLPVFNQLAARRLPKHAARHALGWDAATPTILFFGLVRAYKGLGPLIEAVALLRQQSHALRLAIVGEFWDDPQPYRQRIAALGLDGCVQVINRYVPDADALTLFSAADVFAAPYERGTQSGAVSMALSFGLPVVTTTHIAGGLAPEQQARLCLMSDHSPAAIAQALVQALSANRDAAPTSPNTNANANAEAEAEAAAAWESLVNAIV